MSDEIRELEYNENDSLQFIKEYLSEDMRDELSDEDISYIVDLMYDFYEDSGLLDEADEDEMAVVEINDDELLDYIMDAIEEDDESFTFEQVEAVISGELAYCDSLNLFEEDEE